VVEKSVILEFDPFSLPTVQHRAGLAGLLVLVESMRRRESEPLPDIEHTNGLYRITLTKETLTSLFNELYDGVLIEMSSEKKPSKREKLIRVEESTDEKTGKKKRRYIFNQPVPKAAFLKYGYSMPEPWVRLWRDTIWYVVRERHKKRLPYEERIKNKDVSEAGSLWQKLICFDEKRSHGILVSADISSSIFVGAQARNAEKVRFKGRVDENFLLHFWPVVIGVFIPEQIEYDHNKKTITPRFDGYVIAIPDVTDHEGFLQDFPQFIAELDKREFKNRPRDSIISVPQEGGLEYMYRLLSLAKLKAGQQESIEYNTAGVEVFHLEKRGNNVVCHAADTVDTNERLVEDYGHYWKTFLSPIFRRQSIMNLLRSDPWYRGFDQVFALRPLGMFLASSGELFTKDASRRFADIEQEEEEIMGEESLPTGLVLRIRDIVRAYVLQKSEAKSGEKIDWDEVKKKRKREQDDSGISPKYREARERVCEDAFLRLRSCKSRTDFINYFTGTICSVPQYIPEDDFLQLSETLLEGDKWMDIKSLAMMALSAFSRV